MPIPRTTLEGLLDHRAPLSAPAATAVVSAASMPASAPRALDLTVHAEPPRPRPVDDVANDARSNTHRPTAAERMAQALGSDDRAVEEIRPDGTVRMRKGADCYDARVSQAAVLDAYNTAVLPKPRLVSPC